ncbi:mavicyanin [Benincasa hispida]|uniref:mavicyanin n=1 Tax=Benincasa hispida TaxID=102211 RepID=UPI001900225B|nr:mavicyanin [Benincasa hispida]
MEGLRLKMKMKMKMKRDVFVVIVAAVALMAEKGLADQRHVVGGSQGWQESVDFDSWASAQTFKVGDQIVFKYDSGLHSVVELPDESSYKKCDIGNSVETKSSGNDAIKLTKSGTRYFACGTIGHCSQGMKVKIHIATGTASSTPSPPSSSSSSSSSSHSHHSLFGFFLMLLPFYALRFI